MEGSPGGTIWRHHGRHHGRHRGRHPWEAPWEAPHPCLGLPNGTYPHPKSVFGLLSSYPYPWGLCQTYFSATYPLCVFGISFSCFSLSLSRYCLFILSLDGVPSCRGGSRKGEQSKNEEGNSERTRTNNKWKQLKNKRNNILPAR